MKKIQILGLALFAMFAFSGVVTSMASASPTWWEEGSELANGEASGMTTKATVGMAFILRSSVVGVDTAVECTGVSIVSGLSYNENKSGLDLGKILFSGCNNKKNCPNVPTEIETLGELSELGRELLPTAGLWVDIFYPAAGGLFAEFLCGEVNATVTSNSAYACVWTGTHEKSELTHTLECAKLVEPAAIPWCNGAVTEVEKWNKEKLTTNLTFLGNPAIFCGVANVKQELSGVEVNWDVQP